MEITYLGVIPYGWYLTLWAWLPSTKWWVCVEQGSLSRLNKTIGILGQTSLLLLQRGADLIRCKMFSSIPGLYPLEANSTSLAPSVTQEGSCHWLAHIHLLTFTCSDDLPRLGVGSGLELREPSLSLMFWIALCWGLLAGRKVCLLFSEGSLYTYVRW